MTSTEWAPQPVVDDRTPPNDAAAEQAVLGAMLLSKDAIADVVEVLRGADFYRPAHESIYDAIIDLYSTGEGIDPVTVSNRLLHDDMLIKTGGAPYLHTLTASLPMAANARYYADIVHGHAIARRVIEAGRRITQIGYSTADPDEKQEAAEEALLAVDDRRTGEDYRPVSEVLEATIGEMEAIASRDPADLRSVPTGFAELDDLTQGFHPGQMVVVAARPAIGKSTLALDFARAASVKYGLASVIFSLEMSRTEITMKLLASVAKVELSKMRSGTLSDTDWDRIARRMPEVQQAPLFIDDSPNMTLTEIRAKARRLKQRNDLRLIVVDYLQLMTSGMRVESRQLEVAEFSRQLKLLGKELEVPVLAISQLNRGPEQRANKRPMLSDLRESGAIESDADVVILVHRDDAFEKDSTRPGEADLIVAKHRNGPTRDIVLAFQGPYSRFVDMARG